MNLNEYLPVAGLCVGVAIIIAMIPTEKWPDLTLPWLRDAARKSTDSQSQRPRSLPVFKRESLNSFSVADELAKWAKLRDDGIVTEQEYVDARRALLGRD